MRKIFLMLAIAAVALPVLAKEAPDTLKFSHKRHMKDAGLECLVCHEKVKESSAKAPAGLPSMETCGACHEETQNNDKCGFCHTNPGEAAALPLALRLPTFSHGAHLQKRTDCLFCHVGADLAGSLFGIFRTPMKQCMACHNDKKAPASCRTCHADVSGLKPASHQGRWLYRDGHGIEARFDKAMCAQCHSDADCNSCHAGQRGARIHDANYRYTHGLDAKTRDRDCALCHETARQCRSCH